VETTTSPVINPGERLALADWRRRVASMYAAVRDLAATDPERAWAQWRDSRERLYREHESSPVATADRPGFRGLYFDYDPRLRFELPLQPPGPTSTPPGSASMPGEPLPMSAGSRISFDRIGRLVVPFESGAVELTLFWLVEYSGGLFLPFRDATNGAETYGGGRYLLDTAKGADLGGDPAQSKVIVDFNFAYQPSCAFDPMWSCPLSPPENRLPVRIAAGERLK
jgi:uncharacterized protein